MRIPQNNIQQKQFHQNNENYEQGQLINIQSCYLKYDYRLIVIFKFI